MKLPRFQNTLPELKLFHTSSLRTLITWIMVTIAIVQFAYWTSRLISPRPVAALPSNIEAPRSMSAGQDMARVFGVRPGDMEANLDGLALTGVFASHDGNKGFATFLTAKGGVGVIVGEDILPGLRLERVEAGRVVVSSKSGEKVLELPKPKHPEPSVSNASPPAENQAEQRHSR